jgi:hypothetical protein
MVAATSILKNIVNHLFLVETYIFSHYLPLSIMLAYASLCMLLSSLHFFLFFLIYSNLAKYLELRNIGYV